LPTTNGLEINWQVLRDLTGMAYRYVPTATTNTYTYTTTAGNNEYVYGGNWAHGANAGTAATNAMDYLRRRADEIVWNWTPDVMHEEDEQEEPQVKTKTRKRRDDRVAEESLPDFNEDEFDRMFLDASGDRR